MKAILKHIELPTIEQIITVRILRFLEKVAPHPDGSECRLQDAIVSKAAFGQSSAVMLAIQHATEWHRPFILILPGRTPSAD
jgi:hypothetical protein